MWLPRRDKRYGGWSQWPDPDKFGLEDEHPIGFVLHWARDVLDVAVETATVATGRRIRLADPGYPRSVSAPVSVVRLPPDLQPDEPENFRDLSGLPLQDYLLRQHLAIRELQKRIDVFRSGGRIHEPSEHYLPEASTLPMSQIILRLHGFTNATENSYVPLTLERFTPAVRQAARAELRRRLSAVVTVHEGSITDDVNSALRVQWDLSNEHMKAVSHRRRALQTFFRQHDPEFGDKQLPQEDEVRALQFLDSLVDGAAPTCPDSSQQSQFLI